jgi:NRAMP (natural resistance-associated macrophage protein)-like metal ion transporter
VRFGPGLLVAAAFIGPGTLTTASVAGARFGLTLLWALVFSIVTTIVLQEMAARLGLATRGGLAEALRRALGPAAIRIPVLVLVIAAIGLGNAAYESGNLLGAALGASELTGLSPPVLAVGLGLAAAALLATGSYVVLERVLVVLVALMAAVFLACAVVAPPDVDLLWATRAPDPTPDGPDAAVLALALVGTTVVPYNLFLHASAVGARWPADVPAARAIAEARRDTIVSVTLGGIVTLAIMATAAAAFHGTGTAVSAATMAAQLEPVLGPWARIAFASGLLAAGLTSAITAPLAAAWAVAGACGWPARLDDPRLRAVWGTVLGVGTLVAAVQVRPVAAILFAQAANALLLPVVAGALVWVVNRTDIVGERRNGPAGNALALAVLAVVLVLGARRLMGVFGG